MVDKVKSNGRTFFVTSKTWRDSLRLYSPNDSDLSADRVRAYLAEREIKQHRYPAKISDLRAATNDIGYIDFSSLNEGKLVVSDLYFDVMFNGKEQVIHGVRIVRASNG